MRTVLLCCAFAGCVISATAQTTETESEPSSSTSKDRQIEDIASQCLTCHAQSIPLTDIPKIDMPDAIRATIMGEVVHPTAVPELSDKQIMALAEYFYPDES
ncbi:MAG: hypothetical protein ACFHXK_10505 [bacterium]